MRLATITLLTLLFAARAGSAQVGGNVGYGQSGGPVRSRQAEGARRTQAKELVPPTETSMYVDASVLMNVKADVFVATFGVAEEAETVEACRVKMDATVAAFLDAIKPLGIAPEATFVDFSAQTKIYAYDVDGTVARERLDGFELKKTIAVRYRDKGLIDRLVAAASRAKVYDLVKVDYVVTDLAPIQDRLAEEAAAVIKSKVARYERLLGIKLRGTPQVVFERPSIHFPTDQYDSYAAAEGEAVSGSPDRSRLTVQTLRKPRTFYFRPLDADGFDRVIEPVVLEPVVQFTLDLKLRYEIDTRQ